jgi:OOP family OmpA-OmpF porin
MCANAPIRRLRRPTLRLVTDQYLPAFAGNHRRTTSKAKRNHRNIESRDTMKTNFTRKQVVLAVACAFALGLMSTAGAQTVRSPMAEDSAILMDNAGQAVMSQFGECWHSGQGPRPDSTAQCDPNYRAPIAAYVAPAPAPVAAPYVAPKAAPVVVAAAVAQPVYEKVTFDADALFDFNKAALRPAGRDTLDKFAKNIQGINPPTISAVGHTDRIGSTGYNQKLSEERATAVKTYLVSQGVESKNVNASGKGEMQPVTKSGDCKGGKSAKLITCLQPDRRVEVEVSGSRIKQ